MTDFNGDETKEMKFEVWSFELKIGGFEKMDEGTQFSSLPWKLGVRKH